MPDFSSLDIAAARLEQHADELRVRTTRLQAAASSVDWQSPAAAAFRHRSDAAWARLLQCAERIEHAASVLRRHAATARSRADLGEHLLADAAHLVGL